MILKRKTEDSEMSDFLLEESFRESAKQKLRQEHDLPLDKGLEIVMAKELTIGSEARESLKETLFTELKI